MYERGAEPFFEQIGLQRNITFRLSSSSHFEVFLAPLLSWRLMGYYPFDRSDTGMQVITTFRSLPSSGTERRQVRPQPAWNSYSKRNAFRAPLHFFSLCVSVHIWIASIGIRDTSGAILRTDWAAKQQHLSAFQHRSLFFGFPPLLFRASMVECYHRPLFERYHEYARHLQRFRAYYQAGHLPY
mmetsp:Transcript_27777/g.40904  ORF Transcript_27777/g.40904 Transcript_27777/m.40904 type:complete len:184 (-) Transcript_27777:1089-1640(-)